MALKMTKQRACGVVNQVNEVKWGRDSGREWSAGCLRLRGVRLGGRR